MVHGLKPWLLDRGIRGNFAADAFEQLESDKKNKPLTRALENTISLLFYLLHIPRGNRAGGPTAPRPLCARLWKAGTARLAPLRPRARRLRATPTNTTSTVTLLTAVRPAVRLWRVEPARVACKAT